jgi:tRNA-Thr(GGU) m(6)t(6)A37 methyltransferase TsaA
VIELLPPFNRTDAVRGLETASHIWIVFVFHEISGDRPRVTVRPPRLGGNLRLGVFATRSGYRPNPVGISAVELVSIDEGPQGPTLHVRGVDLLDGTPIIDIKPYLPYADCIPEAMFSIAEDRPSEDTPVTFSSRAEAFCRHYEAANGVALAALVSGMLTMDPRPAYRRGSSDRRCYGTRLMDLDIHWESSGGAFHVLEIRLLSD